MWTTCFMLSQSMLLSSLSTQAFDAILNPFATECTWLCRLLLIRYFGNTFMVMVFNFVIVSLFPLVYRYANYLSCKCCKVVLYSSLFVVYLIRFVLNLNSYWLKRIFVLKKLTVNIKSAITVG